MIPDEQIMQLAGEIGDSYEEKLISFARELIALAQQIKSLEVVPPLSNIKHAHTPFGTYSFCAYIDEVRMALPEEMNYYGRGYQTEAEAIEAANEDFRKRVLSCLVWGGGE